MPRRISSDEAWPCSCRTAAPDRRPVLVVAQANEQDRGIEGWDRAAWDSPSGRPVSACYRQMPAGELVVPWSFSQKFAVPAVPPPEESSRQSNMPLPRA